MNDLRTAAQQALEALEEAVKFWHEEFEYRSCVDAADPWEEAATALKAALAEPVQEPDLSRCPKCNGPADNGHDREVPPNPYYCTKCMAEPAFHGFMSADGTRVDLCFTPGAPRADGTYATAYYTAPPPAEPVQEPVAKCVDDICSEHLGRVEAFDHLPRGTLLYAILPQRKPLKKEQLLYIYNQLPNWGMDMDSLPQGLEKFARAVERAHGIGVQP